MYTSIEDLRSNLSSLCLHFVFNTSNNSIPSIDWKWLSHSRSHLHQFDWYHRGASCHDAHSAVIGIMEAFQRQSASQLHQLTIRVRSFRLRFICPSCPVPSDLIQLPGLEPPNSSLHHPDAGLPADQSPQNFSVDAIHVTRDFRLRHRVRKTWYTSFSAYRVPLCLCARNCVMPCINNIRRPQPMPCSVYDQVSTTPKLRFMQATTIQTTSPVLQDITKTSHALRRRRTKEKNRNASGLIIKIK